MVIDIEKFSYLNYIRKDYWIGKDTPEFYFLRRFTNVLFLLILVKIFYEFKLLRYRYVQWRKDYEKEKEIEKKRK